MNTFTVYLTEWVNTEQVIDIAYDNKDMYTCTHPLAINVNIVVVDISMFKVIFWTTLHTNDNFTVFRFNQNSNYIIARNRSFPFDPNTVPTRQFQTSPISLIQAIIFQSTRNSFMNAKLNFPKMNVTVIWSKTITFLFRSSKSYVLVDIFSSHHHLFLDPPNLLTKT